jgi:hypothetical protein
MERITLLHNGVHDLPAPKKSNGAIGKKKQLMASKGVNYGAKKVGVINLRGLVEVEILGEQPQERELLGVEGHPEVYLEVNYYKPGYAVCINLTNSRFALRYEVSALLARKLACRLGQKRSDAFLTLLASRWTKLKR